MRRLAPAIAVVAILGAWRSVSVAGEARPRLTLDWVSTPACASRSAVLDDVAHILNGSSAPDRTVAARVQVHRTERGAWSVFLAVDTDGGSRQRWFDAESCEAAEAGVAFILAVAVDPAVATKGPPPPAPPVGPPPTPSSVPSASTSPSASAPVPAPPPSAAPAAVVPSEASKAARPVAPGSAATPASAGASPPSVRTPASAGAPGSSGRSFPDVVALAAVGVDTGTLARAAVGFSVAAGLQSGGWRFDLAGSYWTAQSATAGGGAAGGQFRAFSAEGRVAYGWRAGRLSLGPLVGVGAESIGATGFGGTVANYAGTVPVGTVDTGGFAAWRILERAGLRLDVTGEWPLRRESFSVIEPPPQPNALVFRMAPLVGRALLGIDLRF